MSLLKKMGYLLTTIECSDEAILAL
jgi:hypothetical protein